MLGKQKHTDQFSFFDIRLDQMIDLGTHWPFWDGR